MLKTEFERLSGIYLTDGMYKVVEEQYYACNDCKQDFCKSYKDNQDGVAEKVQRQAEEMERHMTELHKAQLAELDKKILLLRAMAIDLKEKLEKEEEWAPYELKGNVPQKEYLRLESTPGVKVLSEAQAKDELYHQFGFAREKVKLVTEVDAYEINRHKCLRVSGKLARKPLYFASDMNYIRFDCGCMQYELVNGELSLFES